MILPSEALTQQTAEDLARTVKETPGALLDVGPPEPQREWVWRHPDTKARVDRLLAASGNGRHC